MKKIIIAAFMILLFGCASNYQEIIVQPKGEFANIDTSKSIEAIKSIQADNPAVIKSVVSSPGEYAPPVLYAVSSALLNSGEKREAMFWFYAGQLRARSDANKSLDPSARQAVSVMNQKFGPSINKFALSDIENLKKTVYDVVEWDKKTERNYDPRWIAHHGMDAFTKSKIRFEPKLRWKEINTKTRDEYLEGFHRMLKMMKK